MLETPITSISRITEVHKKALKTLGISTYRDLLYHTPTRYADARELRTIATSSDGDEVTLYGVISNPEIKKAFQNIPASARATLTDHTGSIKLIWFGQAYISKIYTEGAQVKVSGRVTKKGSSLSIVNPTIVTTKSLPIDSSDSLFAREQQEDEFLTPIYKETKGITSNYIHHLIKKIVSADSFTTLADPIPEHVLKQYNLPSLHDALLYIHFPKTIAHAEAARKRIAFEEIFYIQLERNLERAALKDVPGFVIENNKTRTEEFIRRFPFELTGSQKKAVDAIFSDFAKGVPMSRLIEGDVGSGKTAVAAIVAHLACITRPYIKEKGARQEFGTLQVAYMAPTEILARQHFENFVEYFKGSGLSLALITGNKCLKYPSKSNPGSWTEISKPQLKKWVANGEISMVIGTHTLIQKSVEFKHLALCIIDEQHRFGVKQRKALTQKKGAAGIDAVPHLISMTATPIPRTLALTIYGDLDLTLIDTMPLGRKKVITEVVTPDKRDGMYEKVLVELANGRQVYVICPRIDEPDPNKSSALSVKSVESEAARLQKNIFNQYTVGTLHGKMKPAEKDARMKAFSDGDLDILVATSVVEVGVNVPNATVVLIEGAERFGLSQLHQLRGRVIRGTHQSYCYLLSDNAGDKTIERLQALVTAKNGFELAETDLMLRGSGALTGGKQWGVTDIAMEAIKNKKLVEAARTEAQKIVAEDIGISNYPTLKKILSEREKTHME